MAERAVSRCQHRGVSIPFPSMDPWLEDPGLWPDVHNSLIAALRFRLGPILRPRYFVSSKARAKVVASISVAPVPDPA